MKSTKVVGLLVLGVVALVLLGLGLRSNNNGPPPPPQVAHLLRSDDAASSGSSILTEHQQQQLQAELASLRQLIQLQHAQVLKLADSRGGGGDGSSSSDVVAALSRLEAQLVQLQQQQARLGTVVASPNESGARGDNYNNNGNNNGNFNQPAQDSHNPLDNQGNTDLGQTTSLDPALALSMISGHPVDLPWSSWTNYAAYPASGRPELGLPPLPRCWLQAFTRGPSAASALPQSSTVVHSRLLEIPQALVPRPHPELDFPASRFPDHTIWPRYRWMFIGCGYTGTGLASHLMKQLGWDVGHEVVGRHGESSWLMTFPTLGSKDIGPHHPAMYELAVVMTRNPLSVVRSGRGTRWAAMPPPGKQFNWYYRTFLAPRLRQLWPELGEPEDVGEDLLNLLHWLSHTRAALYYVGCTDPTAGNTERPYASHLVWRTDLDRAEDLLPSLGIPVTPEMAQKALAATQVRKNAHAKAHHVAPSWNELRTTASRVPGDSKRQQRMVELVQEAYDLSRALGYNEQIEAELYNVQP